MNLRRLIHHLADGYDQAPTVLPPTHPKSGPESVESKGFQTILQRTTFKPAVVLFGTSCIFTPRSLEIS